MNQPAQKGAGCQHDGGGRKLAAIDEPNARDAPIGERQIVRLAFNDGQALGRPDGPLHGGRIKLAVGLRAGAPHRGAFAPIEHAKLDAALVGNPSHQAVEGVDLAHQVALAEAPDGRIA